MGIFNVEDYGLEDGTLREFVEHFPKREFNSDETFIVTFETRYDGDIEGTKTYRIGKKGRDMNLMDDLLEIIDSCAEQYKGVNLDNLNTCQNVEPTQLFSNFSLRLNDHQAVFIEIKKVPKRRMAFCLKN